MSKIINKLNPLKNTVEQLHTILRKEIIDMLLKPGEPIFEKELCQRFGVSRTPVREACMRLSFDNLVEIFPQRGTFVTKIRRQDVHEDHFVRDALETATITYAVELEKHNREYEKKFGYIFIVCATGKSAQEMLDLIRQRLKNTPQIEINIAAWEQNKITNLRLKKMLEDA